VAAPAAAPPAPVAEPAAPVAEIAPPPPAAVTPVEPVAPPVAAETATQTVRTTAPIWPWVLGGLVVLAGLIGLLALRRRRAVEDSYEEYDAPVASPVAEPVFVDPIVAAPVIGDPIFAETPVTPRPEPELIALAEHRALAAEDPAATASVEDASVHGADADDVDALTAGVPHADRPWLEFAMRPVRAGTNADDAVVEFELTVGNSGSVDAEDVRISAFLLTANPDQDSEIERMLLDPRHDAAIPEVTIVAGGGTCVEAAIALPKEGVHVVTAANRPFFVPMLVADARYRLPDGSEGRTSASFMIGRARDDNEKLAPIFLDRGARMHDDVEARLHGEPTHA
jgi:hypothetical protein